MMIDLLCGGVSERIELPRGVVELQDILDRTPMIRHDAEVTFRLRDGELLRRVHDTPLFKVMTADLYLLNEFVRRYEGLSQTEKIAFAALVNRQQPQDLAEAYPLIKGLDSVPMILAYDHYQLGRYCIEHELTPEVWDCPAYVRPCLDAMKIGKLADEMLGGIFLDGYYCDIEKYVCPDQSLDIPKPDEKLFRLLIGTPDEHGDENAEWLALPCEDEEIYELEFQFNMGLDMLECYRFESALPTLKVFDLYGKDELFALNALAKNLLELDTTAFLKYKAILKVENLSSFTDAAESLEQMDEYDFSIVADEADFAREYLIAVLPEGFDQTPLYEADMHDFGRAILASKGARMTGYGAVLKNSDLYSPVMDESMRGQISTQCAEPTNEMIGGMSL